MGWKREGSWPLQGTTYLSRTPVPFSSALRSSDFKASGTAFSMADSQQLLNDMECNWRLPGRTE